MLYLLMNFLAPLLEVLVASLSEMFLVGVGFNNFTLTEPLSPILAIYHRFSYGVEPVENGEGAPYLIGLWVVALYALAGLVLLALAWLLCRRRLASPERVLVTKSPVRSTGRVCISPTLRLLYR